MAYDNNDADTSLSAGLQTSREYRLKISLMAYFQPGICAVAQSSFRFESRLTAEAWRII